MIRKAAKKDYDSGDYNSCGTVEEVATAGGIAYSTYENDGKIYRGEWSDGPSFAGTAARCACFMTLCSIAL